MLHYKTGIYVYTMAWPAIDSPVFQDNIFPAKARCDSVKLEQFVENKCLTIALDGMNKVN